MGNFLAARYLGCRGCKQGAERAGAKPRTAADIARDPHADAHVRSMAKNAFPCIRCGRGPADSKTVITHRLIWSCWCPSCDMRSRECLKNGGIGAINSKGGQSTKYRSLRATRLLVLMGDAKLVDLKPIVFADTIEARRFLDRLHPGWALAEVACADHPTIYLERE
ncbi:hypothetical protein C0Z16_04750 [Paraburkholderia rhynchosiae]|uniref:CENP-V/GFA domain-containing protein n=1 Tax=Paraburkholderia rhynchosiae TaxID=487049 RepID=A0ABX4V9W0_9BURK|nr:hypothetical protein C0Z16_04750 [Paraburkholderia rhynchosiae]